MDFYTHIFNLVHPNDFLLLPELFCSTFATTKTWKHIFVDENTLFASFHLYYINGCKQ